jgi:uncharacterized protein Yka (UPF0111/DUF47 family)
MTDETANLILGCMRKFERSLDEVRHHIRDLGKRVTAHQRLAGVNRWLDRTEERVDRIERRLDLMKG